LAFLIKFFASQVIKSVVCAAIFAVVCIMEGSFTLTKKFEAFFALCSLKTLILIIFKHNVRFLMRFKPMFRHFALGRATDLDVTWSKNWVMGFPGT
jgi:hypothetical protein